MGILWRRNLFKRNNDELGLQWHDFDHYDAVWALDEY